MVDHLAIAKPCHASWDAMTPNQAGRHCQHCDKTVHDLTILGARDGRTLMKDLLRAALEGTSSPVCIRGDQDRHGRLLTPAHRRLLTNMLAGMLAMSVAGCGTAPDHATPAQPSTTTTVPSAGAAVDPLSDTSASSPTTPVSSVPDPSTSPVMGMMSSPTQTGGSSTSDPSTGGPLPAPPVPSVPVDHPLDRPSTGGVVDPGPRDITDHPRVMMGECVALPQPSSAPAVTR